MLNFTIMKTTLMAILSLNIRLILKFNRNLLLFYYIINIHEI